MPGSPLAGGALARAILRFGEMRVDKHGQTPAPGRIGVCRLGTELIPVVVGDIRVPHWRHKHHECPDYFPGEGAWSGAALRVEELTREPFRSLAEALKAWEAIRELLHGLRSGSYFDSQLQRAHREIARLKKGRPVTTEDDANGQPLRLATEQSLWKVQAAHDEVRQALERTE